MRATRATVAIVAGVALMAAMGAGQASGQPFAALDGGAGSGPEQVSLHPIVSKASVAAGGTVHVAVKLKIAGDSWVYGPYAAGKVVPAISLVVKAAPSPLQASEAVYAPTRKHTTQLGEDLKDEHNVYEGVGYAWVPVTVPADLAPGDYQLPLKVTGQICSAETCISFDQEVVARIRVGAADAASPDWTGDVRDGLAGAKTAGEWKDILTGATRAAARPLKPIEYEVYGGSDSASYGLWTGLGLAILAGLMLNIMPCVLPVLPLRLLTLLDQAGQSRRRFIGLGLAFALGVLLFFVGLAVANAALKTVFNYSLTWGDLFRHPEIVTGLALLLVALAANMFGLFELTLPGRVAEARAGTGALGAVGMGFLVAVLATPCSGAVLAAAFTWAQLQPLWIGTMALVVMGVGMALPHGVIAFFPQIVSRLPRAGAWTGLFKDFVGFVLLMIAAWLVGNLAPESNVAWVLAFAVVLGMCLWMWGKWVGYTTPPVRKWATRSAAAVLAVGAGVAMLSPSGTLPGWYFALAGDKGGAAVEMKPFDRDTIALAQKADKTVLVKFTANWCTECKIVELGVYDQPAVSQALRDRGVVVFEGDVTTRNMPANAMLYDQLGQSGPPLAAIFPAGGKRAVLLRGAYGKEKLLEAIDYAVQATRARAESPPPRPPRAVVTDNTASEE